MLSLAKLRVGQEAYQLSGVAESLDAYYTGAGEAPGEWLGGGAARLGLDGEVAPTDLRAVLAGIRPGTGGLSPNGDAIHPTRRRVPGFDATFKAPKSASVLYAVSDDPRVQGAVIGAGNHAVREALGWLEREAIEVQRGSHNLAWVERKRAELVAAGEDPMVIGPRRLKTSGVVAATFRHRTSRAGDPLLHWHTLIANIVEGSDGKWSAFAHPDLYRHARAAGEIFQAAFRAELTRTLGVEWRPGRHVPEIAGIPQSLLDGFSKRRAEIKAWITATGAPADPSGQQAAVLATRRSKHEREADGERLDAGWKREATDAGWGPEQAGALVTGLTPRHPVTVDDVWRLNACGVDDHGRREDYELLVGPDAWIAHLLRTELTIASTTFTDTDVATAIARRLGAGATVATIDRITDRVLSSAHVMPVDTGANRRRFTSREMHDIERRFTTAVQQTSDHRPVDTEIVRTAMADRPTLGADQAAAVQQLCAATGRVSVLIGPAGTGKTFTLDTVRDAFEHAGWRVIGAGPSARAAQELTAGAAIPARTLHSLLGDLGRGIESFDSATLLVVDEAGMADIRTLEQIVTAATTAGGRVLLVGDQHQMPAVGAGGGFAYAATHAADVAELTVNRRQRDEWEQHALGELRNGSVANAVDQYLDHGRVLVANDADTMTTAAIQHWQAALDAGLRPVLLAGSNDLVDRLNNAAIATLTSRGLLPDDHSAYGAGHYRVGERVTLRRNSTGEQTTGGERIDVANGQLATVIAVDGGQLTVRLDRRPDVDVVLDDRYLARGGHVSHGYALSTHRAQGGTWDLSITVGLDGLYREAAYTDLSRGITENWLIITDPDLAQLHAEATNELDRHDTGINPDTHPNIPDELIDRLNTSRAKHLAHSDDPDHGRADHLARTIPLADLEARLAVARRAAHLATAEHGTDRDQLIHTLSTIGHTARRLTPGVEVRGQDRHNVGTIDHVHDTRGTAHIAFVSADGNRTAERELPWEQLTVIDRNARERTLTQTAEATVQRIRDDTTRRLDQWCATVAAHGAAPDEVNITSRAIRQQLVAATHQLAGDQPDWLLHLVGPRPSDPLGEDAWHNVVADIVAWRSDHHITSPGLGPAPADPADMHTWQRLHTRSLDTRHWLTRTDRHEPAWPTIRSPRELIERRDQLDAILDAAPADTHHLIHAARAGQLTLTDLDDLVNTADGARIRQDWILEHWPHVVELHETTAALDERHWTPERRELFAAIHPDGIGDRLAAAIDADPPWLAAALGALDLDPDTSSLTDEQIEWLDAVADHRADFGITTRDPLGEIPSEQLELEAFDQLLYELGDVRAEQAVEHHPLDIRL